MLRFEDGCSLAFTLSQWKHELQDYGPGVIDLQLEQIDTDARIASFLELLDVVSRQCESYGSCIPASIANSLSRAEGATYVDYSTAMIIDVVDKLRSLVMSHMRK
jgi:hypothetical protein